MIYTLQTATSDFELAKNAYEELRNKWFYVKEAERLWAEFLVRHVLWELKYEDNELAKKKFEILEGLNVYPQAINREWGASFADFLVAQISQNYRRARAAYQQLRLQSKHLQEIDESWAVFCERQVDHAYRKRKRQDEAILWQLDAVAATPDDEHRWNELDTMLAGYSNLLLTFRHAREVEWVAISPDGSRLATASRDRTARLWGCLEGTLISSALNHNAWVQCVAFAPDGAYYATADVDGHVLFWDGNTGNKYQRDTEESSINLGTNSINLGWRVSLKNVEFRPDGKYLFASYWDNTLKSWNMQEFRPGNSDWVNSVDGAPLLDVAFNVSSDLAVTAQYGLGAHIWSIKPGDYDAKWESRGKISAPSDVVYGVEFSADNRYLATVGEKGLAKLWYLENAKSNSFNLNRVKYQKLKHNSEENIWLARFSADSRLLATAADNGKAYLWDVASGQKLSAPWQDNDGIKMLAFGAKDDEGQLVSTAHADGTARLWRYSEQQTKLDIRKQEPVQLQREWQKKLGLKIDDSGKVVPLHA